MLVLLVSLLFPLVSTVSDPANDDDECFEIICVTSFIIASHNLMLNARLLLGGLLD